jgi:DMSO/TMAO reductase YedYZ molybdopterin-dependent catalytic subunit
MTAGNHPSPTPRESIPIGRAAFLGTVVAGVGSIALLSRFAAPVSRAVQSVASAVPVVNQIVPTSGWRIYTVADTMPRFDPATYTLRISGLVERPVTLAWRDFDALPPVTQVSDFHCVTGWTVSHVTWQGVRPRTLVDLVRPLASARYVTFVSMEKPYVDQLSLNQFLLPEVLLASRQDGAALRREHGAPLRLVIPEMYGYKNVKWVSEIRFDAANQPGFWEQNGYDVNAWVGRSNGFG